MRLKEKGEVKGRRRDEKQKGGRERRRGENSKHGINQTCGKEKKNKRKRKANYSDLGAERE